MHIALSNYFAEGMSQYGLPIPSLEENFKGGTTRHNA